jgi:Cu+-exporting ATPase
MIVDQIAQPCVHCGQPSDEPIHHNNEVFCCNGCVQIHDLLHPVANCPAPNQSVEAHAFAHLDLPEYRARFIRIDADGHAQVVLFLPDMECASCVQFLEQLHMKNAAIVRSEVNFPKKEVRIQFDIEALSLSALARLLASCGYPPEIRSTADQKNQKRDYRLVAQIGVAGFCFGNIMLMSFPEYLGAADLNEGFRSAFGWLNLLLSIPVVLYSGFGYLKSAWAALKNSTVNIDVPIAIGIFALFGRSTWDVVTGSGIGFFDSLGGLIFFLLIGKWYQARTFGALSYDRDYKSYFPIAVLRKNGNEQLYTSISELKPGDEIIIHHREIIPADSVLVAGNARIDYSFVTGEAEPIKVSIGEPIQAGGRQTGAAITLVVKTPVEQSRLTRLWNSEAFKKDAGRSIEDPVNRISKHFTWIILTIAVTAFIYWYPKSEIIAWNAFTATLIIACPCALALTLPFTLGSVMRLMGKSGMYLKNASIIETMSKIKHLVFDKTGTLTRADDYKVTWHGVNLDDQQLEHIVSITDQSAHPLSRAISNAYKQSRFEVCEYEELPGLGIRGLINHERIQLGSRAWLNALSNTESGTQTHVEIGGVYLGYFSFEKPLRTGLNHELETLSTQYNLHLLSGDNNSESQRFATYFGNAQMHFDQQPEDKMAKVLALRADGKVAMIGDGLNDAGALKASDFGVAVVDDLYAFSPACDAILHATELKKFDAFLKFSKSAMRIVKRSFFISFVYNSIGIAFAVQGLLTPLVAAILMPASSVTVVLFTVLSAHYYARKHRLSND